MTPEHLYKAVYELFAADDEASSRRILATVDSQWPAMHGRITTHDAETSRLASLAAVKVAEHGLAAQWRARALSRFAGTGWVEGVATRIMSDALVELARANDDYPQGQFLDVMVPAPSALAVLDEIEPFTVGDGSGINLSRSSPSPALLARFLHEKRGFFLLVGGDYSAALESYRRALDLPDLNLRGHLKVRLGIALVEYVSAVKSGEHVDGHPTSALVAEAEASNDVGLTDLINIGRFNAGEIDAGTLRVKPYEVL
ncbi:hypothetical protein [Mycolicibacterium vanbaalenii]|uniref:Tetratricopeptide repeat protein n=1 Tax=Mycolicibacterium vanbaalenii (strain DSM 7251 / JCM 13017 / BCRC 16820 / KCTC 9966 / NRRL B-24157 / PYR-1) TaxID=350058 RepID=A1THV7_MYCVP|nr:hypothetical protein [Mycolicibacterium vanbaalenii]ABM16757.1 hypothetical protein Mvan_6002 [Mycolicibacterium vanbaalenii PYR-1]MCV7126965.1 hypothetical protein [Mycolicibacterium vanbaalenii PYR-1]